MPPELIEHADEFLAAMERYAPDVRVQAYLGQIEERGGGILDLDDEQVRGSIVATSEEMLAVGFEGIHFDIEPVFPGDESFLDLLDRTGSVTEEHDAVLSVALEQLEFTRPTGMLLDFLWPGYHNPPAEFLEDVASRVDPDRDHDVRLVASDGVDVWRAHSVADRTSRRGCGR